MGTTSAVLVMPGLDPGIQWGAATTGGVPIGLPGQARQWRSTSAHAKASRCLAARVEACPRAWPEGIGAGRKGPRPAQKRGAVL